MEPPVASSGPMLRRAATFSHRTERALKDVNGRVGIVNRSQEHPLTSKTTVDAQKVTRPTKMYSTVASRYAAPTIASKKAASITADGAHGGHANVTKLPFITGRSIPNHQRKPSSDNVSSFQPPMVFSATSRDSKPDTLAKKADIDGNFIGAKRPRVGVRASMVEKKSPVQTRSPRFPSLDKGGCTCSKSCLVRGSADLGSASLLYSAAHWLSLIRLAKGEKKHEVVVDLFRLAITLKAEPSNAVVVELKRYHESCPSDKVVNELVQLCEGTQPEVVDKAVCEPGDLKNTPSAVPIDSSAPVGRIAIVPSPAPSENESVVGKDVAPAKKAPHFMGRTLSRSATFSVVDEESQSQHAKAEYGKKLAKTLEFLSTTQLVQSPSKTGVLADHSPAEAQISLAGVPEAGTICQSPSVNGQLNVEPSEKVCTSFQSQRVVLDDQGTPGFKVASKILDLASVIGSKVVAAPASDKVGSPVSEAGSTSLPELGNGSAEKPVESLSKWLDGESPNMRTPKVQSSLREDSVDFNPQCKTGVVAQSSPFNTQNAPPACVPEVESTRKSTTTSKVHGQGSLEPSAVVGCKYSANSASATYSSPVSEVGSTRGSALCNGSAEKPVGSLSEWLEGDSSEMGTPDVQSAPTQDIVDLSPNSRAAVKLMDVDSLMKEVVSHIVPNANLNSTADSSPAHLSGQSSANEFLVRRKSWQDAGEQSMAEIVDSISRSHRHSLSAEANLLSVPGSVEKKVKLFTELAEVKGATGGVVESSSPGSVREGCHEAEVKGSNEATLDTESAVNTTVETQFVVEPQYAVETPTGMDAPLASVGGTESPAVIPVLRDSRTPQSEASKVPLVTASKVSSKVRSKRSDAVPPTIPATPSDGTPCEPASVTILKARHRRSSSMGNMTPRSPFDLPGKCSLFADSPSSPSAQSSSAKSKRVSRGYKDITPRMDLPKPSWKSVVEREMKGSKLKDLLAAELPKETSPLAEYVQSQMENQSRDPECGSTGAKEKGADSLCNPARPVRKMGRSSSMKKPAGKEDQQEGAAELTTAHSQQKQNEGEQEQNAGTNGCSTPGSAIRRSARLQKKVQSRRNMLFKEEFVYL